MGPFRFIILWACVAEIAGYDEDVVFLIMPNESEFLRCVPLALGTCMLCRIINVIKESEIDRLSVLWAMAQTSCLLSRHGTTDLGMGAVVHLPPKPIKFNRWSTSSSNGRMGNS